MYPSTATKYGMMLSLVITATLVTKLLSLAMGIAPLIVFVAAVTFSTIWGNWKMGLLSLLLTVLVINYFFIPPLYALTPDWNDAVRLALFGLAVGVGFLFGQKTTGKRP
jgi:hypothetical protein